MRIFLYAFVLLLGSACSIEQDKAAKQENLPVPEVGVYKRALAYGTQMDLNKLDAEIEKNLLVRLYRIPLSDNDCFVETHGICQYEYLLSVSSFDEQPEVNVFKLPLVGEIIGIGWNKHSGVDEAKIELSLNQYSEAALKNNPALKNVNSRHGLTVNLKSAVVTAVKN